MPRSSLVFACLLAGLPVLAEPENLLPVKDFRDGLTGWRLQPGPAEFATVEEDGQVVRLAPRAANFGLDSAPLTLGAELDPGKTYIASAMLKNEGLTHGVFAFSVCAYDAKGNRLSQMAAHNLSVNSPTHDWQAKSLTFGKATPRVLPEGTHTVRLRFSFHDRDGKPGGTVLVRDAAAAEQDPGPFPDWPASILADVGRLQVRFERRSFWSLYRIDHEGVRLGKDSFGSHYGTVANFAGLGFVGTGHTENEDEQVIDLELRVDGQRQPVPAESYACGRIELRKRSRLRTLDVVSSILVADGRIVEEARLSAREETRCSLIYHFMHPWVHDMSDFLAELPDGNRVEGAFVGDKAQKVSRPTRWSAVYSRTLGRGAVTVVWDVPDDLPWQTRYWDVPEVYRKHYFTTFVNAEVPTGREFRYRVVTIPFAADAESWQQTAAAVAAANPRPAQ